MSGTVPAELTDIFSRKGRRALFFVEGTTDADLLSKLYKPHRASVIFESYKGGGHQSVDDAVALANQHSRLKNIYGIKDRDFASCADVEASITDASPLFLWRYYNIENYLLEPNALAEASELDSRSASLLTTSDADKFITDVAVELIPMMACQKILFDKAGTYFPRGYDISRDLLAETAAQIGVSRSDLEADFQQYCNELTANITDADSAKRFVDGKKLFHHVRSRLGFHMNNPTLTNVILRRLKEENVRDFSEIIDSRFT